MEEVSMRPDMELIRKIALAVEDSPSGYAPDDLTIDGFTGKQIGYHAHLMIQAGLATGSDVTTMGSDSPQAMLTSLTWDGHEFVRMARDETRWKKTMGIVEEKGGSVTLSVLTQVLAELMKQAFGL
jgi:hypothetical protein